MSVYEQLKRRNVIRVAALYVVVSWLILQVADVFVDAYELPNWSMRLLIAILLLGFPLALAFSWIFELTPKGVLRESEIPEGSNRRFASRKLNVAIVVLLTLGIGVVAIERIVPEEVPEGIPERTIAVLPFVYVRDGRQLKNDINETKVQQEMFTLMNGHVGELKIQDPQTTVALLRKNGVNDDTFDNYMMPEICNMLGVEYVLRGVLTINQEGSTNYSSNYSSYSAKENKPGAAGRTGHRIFLCDGGEAGNSQVDKIPLGRLGRQREKGTQLFFAAGRIKLHPLI